MNFESNVKNFLDGNKIYDAMYQAEINAYRNRDKEYFVYLEVNEDGTEIEVHTDEYSSDDIRTEEQLLPDDKSGKHFIAIDLYCMRDYNILEEEWFKDYEYISEEIREFFGDEIEFTDNGYVINENGEVITQISDIDTAVSIVDSVLKALGRDDSEIDYFLKVSEQKAIENMMEYAGDGFLQTLYFVKKNL